MDASELNAQLTHLFQAAEAASSEGLVDEAIKRCEAALDLLDMNPEEDVSYSPADFMMLAGGSCFLDGDLESALRFYRQAYDTDPGRVETMIAVGVTLYNLCRFHAARTFLEIASVEDPDNGEAWYYLGLISLRFDDRELGEMLLARAHDLEPEKWPKPMFLTFDEIFALVEEILSTVPDPLRETLKDVAIVVEERPSMAFLMAHDPPLDPLLLGFFDGVPLSEQSVFDAPAAPTRILVFSENIAFIASDGEKLYEELAITLKHEIGHYLGLDEDDLAARGLD